MAPARRPRSPSTDIDSESEKDTPKPQRTLKKRLSEVHRPHADGGDVRNPDTSRVPLRSVNINDDAAEKRRRRKSTKLNVIENVVAGPSSEGGQEHAGSLNNETGETSKAGKQKQLNTVAPPTIDVSLDVMSSNFEEWMKMATDNKINTQNTWNFALIDYFHDMKLLRNDGDNSINFQRASCTLDGCVKIWTSRVDSVSTETGKLLSNLESGRDGADDDDGDESDAPDGEPSQSRKRKEKERDNNGRNTLVKDPQQLKNKKPDLEFSVDPLFKKTSADFDEGGAGGLLMNHLSLGIGSEGCMRVIFDASDSMGKVEEEQVIEEPPDEVDLSYLRSHFIPNLSNLEDKAIAPSLVGFSFSKDALSFDDATFFADNANIDIGDDFGDVDVSGGDPGFSGDNQAMGEDAGPVEDFFSGADAINDFGGDDFMGGNNDDDSHSMAGSLHGEAELNGDSGSRPTPFVPFDPRRMPNDRDLVLAMDGEGDGALDYFDQTVLKNWAGPEHWKLKKVIRRSDTDSGTSKPNKRQKKEAVKIDFLTPTDKSVKELTAEIFAPPKTGSINLPGSVIGKKGANKKKEKTAAVKEKKNDHRLPDDMHFTSKQLVTLFLKPRFTLRMRGRRAARLGATEGEIDENFWAQAAAEQGASREHDADVDGDNGGAPAPFNTQFFHEEDDFGGGFDDEDGGFGGMDLGGPSIDDAGEQDLLAAMHSQTKRVKPEFVNYARRAKRVDVRKLKENIWKGLEIVVPETSKRYEREEESMDLDEPEEELVPTDPSEARQFKQVMSGLQKTYPRDKMEEISTSFCFICLLHLANEQGLKLEAEEDSKSSGLFESSGDQVMDTDADASSEDRKIGDIWDIKIYRDPTATKSA